MAFRVYNLKSRDWPDLVAFGTLGGRCCSKQGQQTWRLADSGDFGSAVVRSLP